MKAYVTMILLFVQSCSELSISPSDLRGTLVAYRRSQSTVIEIVSVESAAIRNVVESSLPWHVTISLAWSPDGTKIIYTDQTAIYSSDTTTQTRVFDIRSGASSLLFQEHNALVSDFATVKTSGFIAYRFVPLEVDSQQIGIIHLDGSNNNRLTQFQSRSFVGAPLLSPRGDIILFTQDSILYSIRTDGSGLTPLSTNQEFISDPCFSPDGSQIAYCVRANGSRAIGIMNADGSNKRLVTSADSIWRGNPDWSPNGEHIAFYATPVQSVDQCIFVIRPDGTDLTQVSASDGTSDWMPKWTTDAAQIVFRSDGEIFVTDLLGNQKQLTRPSSSSGGGIFDFQLSPVSQ